MIELLECPSSHAHIWSWLNWEAVRPRPKSTSFSPVLKRDQESRVKDVLFWLPCVVSANPKRNTTTVSELSHVDRLIPNDTQASASVPHTYTRKRNHTQTHSNIVTITVQSEQRAQVGQASRFPRQKRDFLHFLGQKIVQSAAVNQTFKYITKKVKYCLCSPNGPPAPTYSRPF